MFEQFEIVALTPNERTHALTIRSEAALVDEYGDEGLYFVSAVNFSPGPSPCPGRSSRNGGHHKLRLLTRGGNEYRIYEQLPRVCKYQ